MKHLRHVVQRFIVQLSNLNNRQIHGPEKTQTNPDLFTQCTVQCKALEHFLKVNNRNTRTRCEIYSKLTIKTPERRQMACL